MSRKRIPLPRRVADVGEVDQAIIACLEKGMTYADLARQFSLDSGTVRYRVNFLRELYEAEGVAHSLPEKKRYIDISKSEAGLSDLDRGILSDWKRGHTVARIASRTGLGETTLHNRLLRLRENLGLEAVPFSPREKLRDVPPGEGPELAPPSDQVRGYVRCLGGCGKMFQSPDRKRIRVCSDCKRNRSKRNIFHVEYRCVL